MALAVLAKQNNNQIAALSLPTPHASIIIVSYNSKAHLERCLQSVQSTGGVITDCEVILVDNASTDGSAELVVGKFPWVKLVRGNRNIGFAAANNLAVRMARGRYIVALNPDTEVTPGWLQALTEPLENKGNRGGKAQIGLTTSRILMMNDMEKVNTCGNVTHISGITVCRGLGMPADAIELSAMSDVPAVSGACFAMKRALWNELGGLDGTFFTYLEDTDLSLRAQLLGYRCAYTPASVVYHSYTGGFSERKFYYLERNRLLMLAGCFRVSTLCAMLPALVLAEGLAWGYAFKNGKDYLRAKAQSYGWLASNRSLLSRKRAQAQATRRATDVEILSAMEWRLDISQLAGPAIGRTAGAILNPLFHLCYLLAMFVARRGGGRKTEGRGRPTHDSAPFAFRLPSFTDDQDANNVAILQ